MIAKKRTKNVLHREATFLSFPVTTTYFEYPYAFGMILLIVHRNWKLCYHKNWLWTLFLQKILDCYCGYKNDMEGYLNNLIQCTVTLAVNIIPGNLEKLQ